MADHFEKLPPELITQIFVDLDCNSILAARRCGSESLYLVSKTRPVWVCAIKKHILTHPWMPGPEECLDAYTDLELEQWLVSRTRAESGWSSGARHQLREVPRSTLIYGHKVLLVPGGRWLLAGPAEGTVIVYDLEASEAKTKDLITGLDPTLDCCRAAIHIDKSSPGLKFNVALALWCLAAPPGSSVLSIWNVMLSGHGLDAELTAQELGSFTIPLQPDMIALDDRHIAQTTGNQIRISRWTESPSAHVMIGIIQNPGAPRWICFLPGARVLSFSILGITVYRIPPTTGHTTTVDRPTHLWMDGYCDRRYYAMSPIFVSGGDVGFTVRTAGGVKAIIIPASSVQPLRFSDLGILCHPGLMLGIGC
ncbi:hypothetical protein BD779DRAFT_1673694 [Infundibulicybe gibba]|nr:hypothetical protein BD779DRAFT_1673694 [Infundibulicybe gibba]